MRRSEFACLFFLWTCKRRAAPQLPGESAVSHTEGFVILDQERGSIRVFVLATAYRIFKRKLEYSRNCRSRRYVERSDNLRTELSASAPRLVAALG